MDPTIEFPAPGQTVYIGGDRARIDARAKVLGQARYAAEFDPPGALYAVTVRSPIAKGRVRRVNIRKARTAPGVVAIFYPGAAPDIQGAEGTPDAMIVERIAPLQAPNLQGDAVLFAGQIMAVAVAKTLEEAEHAARLIDIDYREDRAAVTLEQGRARAKMPPKRLGSPIQFEDPEASRAVDASPYRVDATYRLEVENHHPMETHATVAHWESDRITVWDTTQGVISTRNVVARALDIPVSRVKVVCPYVGGGFGCKGPVWPHTPLIAAISRTLGQPVKYTLSRQEMTHGTGHRPENVQRVRIGVDADGRITGLSHENTAQTAVSGEYIEPCSAVSTVAYASPHIHATNTVVPLDRPGPCFMRGPGEQPGTFALECAVDEAAEAVGMDPVAFRILNQPSAHPISGKPWSLRNTEDCFRRGMERIGWNRRSSRPGQLRDGEWRIGYGCAQAMFPGYRWGGAARVRMGHDASVTVSAATQDIGTGTYTIMAQAAGESFGINPDRIHVQLGDSDLPQCGSSGGSTTAASVLPAVLAACEEVKAKLARMASSDSEGPLSGVPVEDISVRGGAVVAGRREEPLESLLARNRNLQSSRDAPEATAATDVPSELSDYGMDSSAAQFCKLRVNPATGEWKIDNWVGVFDVGRILNTRLATSQLKGGIIYGLGAALMEATATDPRSGRIITRGLADYHIPVHADIPELDVEWIGEPDPVIGPLGNRGIGEIGSVGVSAAIANAIHNATGKRLRHLPLVPERILEA